MCIRDSLPVIRRAPAVFGSVGRYRAMSNGAVRTLPPARGCGQEPARPLRQCLLLDQVPNAGRIDLDPGAHRGADGDRLDVLALRRRRLGAQDLVEDGTVVLNELDGVEGHPSDTHVRDTELVGAVPVSYTHL